MRDSSPRDSSSTRAEDLLEATRLSEVADASVTQLEGQERQARSLFTNGAIGKNDLLRAGLALATARQRSIQAHGQAVLGKGQLATLMGILPGEPLEAIPFVGDPPPHEASTVEAAESRASAQRLELRELDRQIEQAGAGLSDARAKLCRFSRRALIPCRGSDFRFLRRRVLR